MINLTHEEIQKLTPLGSNVHNNGGQLYIKDENTLYKIFHNRYYFIEEKERNIDFLIKQNLSCPKAQEKIEVDGEFYGYSQPYIKNSSTFLEKINNKKEVKNTKKIIEDIFMQLKELHDLDVFMGDIHLDNLIYTDDNGYIIDLDDIRMENKDDFKFFEYYCLRNNDTSPTHKIASRKTDIMKLYICALSFEYNYNFENYVKENGLDAWFLFLKELKIPIIEEIKDMWYKDEDLFYIGYEKNKNKCRV